MQEWAFEIDLRLISTNVEQGMNRKRIITLCEHNAALTRGPQLAGAEGPCEQGTSRSNGLVGAACSGAGRDMDPIGATPHWRRRRRRQRCG
jgi:hypothetical protein